MSRSRSDSKSVTTRRGPKVGALKGFAPAAVVLGVLAVAAASAAAAKPQTINLLEVDTSFVAPGDLVEGQPPKAGQVFVIGADFYKWNGARRGVHYGTLQVVCTLTRVTRNVAWQVCAGAAMLPEGQIALEGVIKQSALFEFPVVGGTGAHAGARGYVRVKAIGDGNKSADTFVITG